MKCTFYNRLSFTAFSFFFSEHKLSDIVTGSKTAMRRVSSLKIFTKGRSMLYIQQKIYFWNIWYYSRVFVTLGVFCFLYVILQPLHIVFLLQAIFKHKGLKYISWSIHRNGGEVHRILNNRLHRLFVNLVTFNLSCIHFLHLLITAFMRLISFFFTEFTRFKNDLIRKRYSAWEAHLQPTSTSKCAIV